MCFLLRSLVPVKIYDVTTSRKTLKLKATDPFDIKLQHIDMNLSTTLKATARLHDFGRYLYILKVKFTCVLFDPVKLHPVVLTMVISDDKNDVKMTPSSFTNKA